MRNSVAVVRPYDDPVPADVQALDMITFLFFYHDTTYLDVDRAQMNRKLFAVLKPGGVLRLPTTLPRPIRTSQSAGHFIVSTTACCAERSRRQASNSLPREISGAAPKIPAISRRNGLPVRWTISC
jgi:hypothetical protein